MGGGWNNTGVVAFLYINNCRTFHVGLEEPLTKSESQKIRRRKNRGLVGLDLLRIPLHKSSVSIVYC